MSEIEAHDPARFEELERQVLAAIFRGDQAAMEELMHPDGYGFDATMGLVRQRELIDSIDGLAPGARFAADQVQVVPAGEGVAALTYRLRQWGEFNGTSLPEVVYCSSIWRLGDGRWQAVFHHETPASAGRSD
ncbi:nuclear transport factor 2 family protein [Nocardia pneumoniae]|uniref:nuclear transport factor 2 family protein n=1 Tax=Nocardia pneumoniae TaxID=228601 RepID=UPI00059308B2|nr:nuclear transport factor 2 family protein [Nocardia pneumoniae]